MHELCMYMNTENNNVHVSHLIHGRIEKLVLTDSLPIKSKLCNRLNQQLIEFESLRGSQSDVWFRLHIQFRALCISNTARSKGYKVS